MTTGGILVIYAVPRGAEGDPEGAMKGEGEAVARRF